MKLLIFLILAVVPVRCVYSAQFDPICNCSLSDSNSYPPQETS